jgi:hypothetical protein
MIDNGTQGDSCPTLSFDERGRGTRGSFDSGTSNKTHYQPPPAPPPHVLGRMSANSDFGNRSYAIRPAGTIIPERGDTEELPDADAPAVAENVESVARAGGANLFHPQEARPIGVVNSANLSPSIRSEEVNHGSSNTEDNSGARRVLSINGWLNSVPVPGHSMPDNNGIHATQEVDRLQLS